ncbi:branched-chain amino acid transport system II carrier protein [Phascolarctobacterium succinatutens]|uniref:branched-chain amino acid transport system II carrier protein n=1 Tax=Phascolarctobacterium succinatutens TaxID=626940 RepID=UPI004026C120
MQNDKINLSLIIPIGLMLFSFFFGAGNLIFPPVLGQMAGDNIGWGMLGFCLSGVGFPLLGILAMAMKQSDNPDSIAMPMHPLYARAVTILCALAIGPLFAIPRTAAVSFDTGIHSLLPASCEAIGLPVYTVFFFVLTYFFSINPSKIIGHIGKFLSPMLLICLAVLVVCVFVNPTGSLKMPNPDFAASPFFRGFQEGYNTMDLLAAILFGSITIKAIEAQGITDKKVLTKLCSYAGLIAAFFLAIIYAALAYTGALSINVFGVIPNGATLLSKICTYYMGFGGQIVLALIIFFACLTTSIGLTTAISGYFSELSNNRIQYERLVFFISAFSLVVANFGLENIIKFSIPVICMLYPIIIALVILNIGRAIIHDDQLTFRLCLILTTIFAVFDGLRVANIRFMALDNFLAQNLPLFDIGFGWVVPCFGGIAVGLLLKAVRKAN